MDDVSNVRPIAILAGYMATAILLTSFCIAVIRLRWDATAGLSPAEHARRRTAIAVFSILAAVSFGSTWYHMFRFFEWSYTQWAFSSVAEELLTADPNGLHLGQWLRDTTLFKQAWASTLETPPRAWWSMQIFAFCAVWSVMLAAHSKKRCIPHMWAFMLLGQVVAISFAANLSFLAFTVYNVTSPSKNAKPGAAKASQPDMLIAPPSSSPFWWPFILGANISIVSYIPDLFGHSSFLPVLMVPHILAFAPLLLNSLLPIHVPAALVHESPMLSKVGAVAILLFFTTTKVYSEGGDLGLILSTLHQHPAVSSVGWDVICCWASFAAWHFLGQE